MDEADENVQWEGNVIIRRDRPQEILDEPETAMRRVGTVPLNVEAPDLLETCLAAFSKRPWIKIPVYVFALSVVVLFIGVYVWIDQNVYIGIAVVLVAFAIGGISLYLLAVRGSHNIRAVQSTDRPNLPAHNQAPTTVVTWSRFWQSVDIGLGRRSRSRSTSSSTATADLAEDLMNDLSDFSDDFSDNLSLSSSSGLRKSVTPIPDDHFSRTLRSGKKTSGVISPRSDRSKALKEPAARKSPRSSIVLEVHSSPSQSSVKSIGKRKKITTRRISIHDKHPPFDSGSPSV